MTLDNYRRKTLEDCRGLADKKGGCFLSAKYVNNKTYYMWRCEKNHTWSATYHNIQRGSWCPVCAGRRKTIKHCRNLAKEHNGECLNEAYVKNDFKYTWKCEKGHVWKACLCSVEGGTWCPTCYKNRHIERWTKTCNDLANEKNGRFLSNESYSRDFVCRWECDKNHQWEASYRSASKTWCHFCSGFRINLKHCMKLASFKGGFFLSEYYITPHSRYKWQCAKGHIWIATYSNIQKGHWCPRCNLSKGQEKLESFLEELLPGKIIYSNFKEFDWLKNGKNHMELDIYIPDLRLAIEFDGRQHFECIDFFGGVNGLRRTKKRDFLKNKLVFENQKDIKYFYRIPYWQNINIEFVRSMLKEIM